MQPKDVLTKEFLELEYIKNKKSVGRIAKEYGIKSSNSVGQFIKKYGLVRENTKLAYKLLTKEILEDLYVNRCLSLKIIALKYKTSKKMVSQKLKELNIPLRINGTTTLALQNEWQRRRGGYKGISQKTWNSILKGAEKRLFNFNLTIEEAWELFVKQKSKCAISGVEIKFQDLMENRLNQTASLDRIDSSKGYTLDNVQWVHKQINTMKMSLTQDKFIEWCKIIAENNK